MPYLLISIVAAIVVSISVYVETSSLVLAFVSYSVAGFAVLMTVLVAKALALRSGEEMEPNKG